MSGSYEKFVKLCYCHMTWMGSEYGVHMSLMSCFTNMKFSSEILSLMVMSMCTCIVCCRISAFCCALILCIIPGCQRRGRVPGPKVLHYTHCGPKGSDGLAASSAVWKPGGYVTGLGYYSLAPHSSRASRLPTVQHCIAPCSPCQLSGWMYCGPAETMAWSVW